jgi:exodeoxyribonuclease VII large subunit
MSVSSHITLVELQRMVRLCLEERFDAPLWISAEISELKLNRSGHCYLNLVEKGSSDATPRAEARAVIWRSAYATLSAKFAAATGATLRSGISVLVRVVVTYHEVYGFSLQIIDLDPSYTLGDIERRRLETIARLQSDGVWDMNRELPPPRPMLRLAVVSSATAAGYRDFIQELQRAPYGFAVTLFESLMQGESAEDGVVCALDAVAEREEEFDCVVIIRGGGSISDLALFDSYRIASHVAQFPLVVITGIGHDKDVSVTDMVAHTSCKTPTAVATTLVELADMEMNLIDEYARDIVSIVEGRLHDEDMRIYALGTDVERLATAAINSELNRINIISSSIQGRLQLIFATEQQRLNSAAHTLQSYSIENILRLGFAVVRSGDIAVTSVANSEVGQCIDVELCDGVIGAEIKSITEKQR